MAKKTKKLSLKRETLRTLSNDQLGAVAGGTLLNIGWSLYGQGGVRGTVPPPPPSGETESIIRISY